MKNLNISIWDKKNEYGDDYLVHFNSKAKNLEISGGEHIMCSPQILKKIIQKAIYTP